MGVFFIDTERGQVATQRQLVDAGVATADGAAPRPWHRVQGTGDASTMWYAVLRKQVKGVFIGTLSLRHGEHYNLLLTQGWAEVAVDEIGVRERRTENGEQR